MITKVSVSKLARVMECSGSLFFEDLPEQPENEKAKEGTAAAEYLEKLINTPMAEHKNINMTVASNGVPIDDEMKYFMQDVYCEIMAKAGSEISAEKFVKWKTSSGIMIMGRYDASFEADGKLYVDDLKYGYGLVEVEENWQLIAYAIGEIIRRNKSYDKIVLRILQPRAHHEDGPYREWEITYNDLLNYKNIIESRMNEIAAGHNELRTGNHCKYCPAAIACTAFNKAFHRGVDIVHEFVQDVMDNDELSYQLDLVNRIEDIVKTRKDSLENLANQRIGSGEIVPNYISKDKYGNREWQPGITPESIEMLTGINITERKILTPAKAEKKGVPKELVKDMTSRKHLGQKLSRVDAKKEGKKIFGNQKPRSL